MNAIMSIHPMLMGNPWLQGLVVGGAVAVAGLTIAGFSIWFERKFAGWMQTRPGPTEVGPAGLLQLVADVFKMLQKDDAIPASADRALFILAPPLTLLFATCALAIIPWGSGVIVADLNIGLLFALSVSSLVVVPVWMAGWASNNKYALLAGMRAAAQAISYEIPLLLAAMVPIVLAGSFRLGDIVSAQANFHWFALWPPGPGLLAFTMFFLASLAEANRIPFDIPEAESELVAGVTTEYGGMKFGLFYLAEYLHTFIASAIAAALFLGGEDMGPLGHGLHWMMLKTLVLFVTIFWVRWSWLRFRADQLMAICWKFLVPGGLVLVMCSALWVAAVMSLLGTLSTLAVSLRNMFRPQTTVPLPWKEERPRSARYRASFALVHDEHGDEACIGCLMCEKICPSDVITVVAGGRRESPNTGKSRGWEDGFTLDLNACIICELCIQVCPADAIIMVREQEAPAYDRNALMLTRDKLYANEHKALSWHNGTKLNKMQTDAQSAGYGESQPPVASPPTGGEAP